MNFIIHMNFIIQNINILLEKVLQKKDTFRKSIAKKGAMGGVSPKSIAKKGLWGSPQKYCKTFGIPRFYEFN